MGNRLRYRCMKSTCVAPAGGQAGDCRNVGGLANVTFDVPQGW